MAEASTAPLQTRLTGAEICFNLSAQKLVGRFCIRGEFAKDQLSGIRTESLRRQINQTQFDDMVPSDWEDKKDALMASSVDRFIAGLFADIQITSSLHFFS